MMVSWGFALFFSLLGKFYFRCFVWSIVSASVLFFHAMPPFLFVRVLLLKKAERTVKAEAIKSLVNRFSPSTKILLHQCAWGL